MGERNRNVTGPLALKLVPEGKQGKMTSWRLHINCHWTKSTSEYHFLGICDHLQSSHKAKCYKDPIRKGKKSHAFEIFSPVDPCETWATWPGTPALPAVREAGEGPQTGWVLARPRSHPLPCHRLQGTMLGNASHGNQPPTVAAFL